MSSSITQIAIPAIQAQAPNTYDTIVAIKFTVLHLMVAPSNGSVGFVAFSKGPAFCVACSVDVIWTQRKRASACDVVLTTKQKSQSEKTRTRTRTSKRKRKTNFLYTDLASKAKRDLR